MAAAVVAGVGGIAAHAALRSNSAKWHGFPSMLAARYGFGLGRFSDGDLIAAGGVSWPVGGSPSTLATVEVLTPGAKAWTNVSPLAQPRENVGATVGEDGRFYVVGGDSLGDPSLYGGSTTLQIYTPSTGQWQVAAPMPTSRTDLAAVGLRDGRILAIGGLDLSGESSAVEAYTPSTNDWSVLAPLPTPCQSVAATTGPDGRVYVVGGACKASQPQNHWSNQLEIYDPATNRWHRGPALPSRRAWAASAWGADGRLYVVGGYNEHGTVASGYAYAPRHKVWTHIPPLPLAMYQHEAVAQKSGIIVLGGCAGGGGTQYCPASKGFKLAVHVP